MSQHLRHVWRNVVMADKDVDEEWEEDALYEIIMAAAVVTVTASCKIIAAKKRRMIWVRPIFQRCDEFWAYSSLYSWQNFGKMMPVNVKNLLMTSSSVACVVVGDWLKPLKQF